MARSIADFTTGSFFHFFQSDGRKVQKVISSDFKNMGELLSDMGTFLRFGMTENGPWGIAQT